MRRSPIQRKAPIQAKSGINRAATKRPVKSRPKMTPIRKSARGQQCQVRVPGICNGDSSTTILAHLNGAGTGAKAGDHEAAYCCSACHSWLDGGYAQAGHFRDMRDLWHLEGVIRTQRLLIEQGLIEVAA